MTVEELMDRIESCVEQAGKLTITSVGFHSSNAMASNKTVEGIFRSFDVVLADGVAMIWASRVLGRPLGYQHRIGGDIVASHLYPIAASHGWGIFCLGGGNSGTVCRAAANLTQAHPDLKIVGTHPWYAVSDSEDTKMADTINRSGATIVLVGMGQPRQEAWIAANKDRVGAAIFIAVGGYFEHVARLAECYPAWVYRWHFNWGYRLLREPRRLWKRYSFGMLKFAFLVLNEKVNERRKT
ncbi:MAG: hypothetical protein A3H95_16115 [Acidobacteria bacterium RIFCSPLOWO2_02_FULL_64_15]|nr:MAG: hypothetical protein A3H95_16115 [Acidobacteria bacterium RIFCSPLOWO2_02_FULL_64_15]